MRSLLPLRRLCSSSSPASGTMNFTQVFNPLRGRPEWKMQPEDYDYQREVARAAFADMLHDTERNHLYYLGLEAAIKEMRSQGQPVHVLDIGTGTGLLSMMAAKIGADSITAVEEFRPVANCAERVIDSNGYGDQIKLVRKRSTDVKVGPGLDMERRANILVTEVFDTELIGEGAIGTYNHAHKELLTDDCLVVPNFGTMYVQVVSSDLAARWHSLHPVQADISGADIVLPKDGEASCHSLHDLQLGEMKKEWFKPITDPVPVFDFDFSGRSGPIPNDRRSSVPSLSLNAGSADAVFFWWDLKMDPRQEITLTCSPKWMQKQPEQAAWRDHWMQAVYYPQTKTNVSKGEKVIVQSRHDEFSLYFDVVKGSDELAPKAKEQEDGDQRAIPLQISRTRLGQINDPVRNRTLFSSLKKAFADVSSAAPKPTCLCLSEFSWLPLMAGRLGARRVYVCEPNRQMRELLERLARGNGLQDVIVFVEDANSAVEITPEMIGEKVDLIIGEPHFETTFLPWHNLLFWYCSQAFMDDGPVRLLPKSAEVWAVPVEYEHLWKIRAPLHQVEGFKMKHFDDIIMNACDVGDDNVEPQPLWEYPCKARGRPEKLMTFDLTSKLPGEIVESEKMIRIEGGESRVNGMALWMVWRLDDENSLNTGPTADVVVSNNIDWSVHHKQGVFFFPPADNKVSNSDKAKDQVRCRTKFDPIQGDLQFQFAKK